MNQGASPWERPFGPRYSQKPSYYYTVCSFKTQPKTLQSGEELLGSGLGKETKGACPAGVFWTGAGPGLVRRRPPPGGAAGGPVWASAGRALPGGFPRRLRRGSPAFSGESRRKERRGLRPLDPRFHGRSFPLAGFWDCCFWYDCGAITTGMLKPIWDAFFGKKYAEKEFCKRKSPNQGTYMGLVIAYRPERCGTTAKTSEWERAGPKQGGAGGHPPATLCVRAFSRESLDPRPGPGGAPLRRG